MEDKDIEWTTLLLLFPSLDLSEVETSYTVIIDLCEHFNRQGRPDLWRGWLSLNLAERGTKHEFSQSYTTLLEKEFGIKDILKDKLKERGDD